MISRRQPESLWHLSLLTLSVTLSNALFRKITLKNPLYFASDTYSTQYLQGVNGLKLRFTQYLQGS
jgi:hypothetical protein